MAYRGGPGDPGDPGDLTRELPGEYNARIRHDPVEPSQAPPVDRPRRKIDARTTRRILREQEEAEQRGRAVIALHDHQLPEGGTEDPSKRGRGRPPLREEVRASADKWRREVKKWIDLLYRLDRNTTLAPSSRKKRISSEIQRLRRRRGKLPPDPEAFPIGDPDPDRRTDLAFLIDRFLDLRNSPRLRGERPREEITDRIVREVFSVKGKPGVFVEDGLPRHGAKPLRQLLRPTKC